MNRFLSTIIILIGLSSCGGGSVGTGILPPTSGSNTLFDHSRDISQRITISVELTGNRLEFSGSNQEEERLIFITYRVERRSCNDGSNWEEFRSGSTGFATVKIDIERDGWCQYRIIMPTDSRQYRAEVVIIDLD